MSLGSESTSHPGSSRDRSADLEDGVESEEYQQSKERAGSVDGHPSEQEDGDEDQKMGAPEGEDLSADAVGADQEDEGAYEQHISSGSTLPTPQSATFPDLSTAAPVFAPPPPPSTRATRSSSRRHSLSTTPYPSLPNPMGFSASKGGSNLAIAVMAPLSSSSGAVTEWANSPQSNPFNYSVGPQPSPQMPSLSPMTISNPYASVTGDGRASNFAPSSGGSGPVTPVSPYTFPAPTQSQLGALERGGSYSAFGKAQGQQSRPRSSGGCDYAEADSHARSRLKRTHDTANGGSHGASTLAAAFDAVSASTEKEPSGQHAAERDPRAPPPLWDVQDLARFYVPPTGPESEVEQAARMATVAASKSGLGAGAFVYKVYHMLLDPPTHPYARFSENGKSFTVYNQAGLSKHILPRHFKHSNFASFVRQLNMYSFHKVNKVGRGQTKAQLEAMPSEFAHPLFEKGKPNQIEQIKRRGPESDQQRVVQRSRSTSEGEGFYERRATRSISGALMGRRYAEDDEEGDDEGEGSMAQSDDEYEEGKDGKEDGPSPAAPIGSPAASRPVNLARNSRQNASSAPSAYSAFRPTGPPSLLAAEARATYSATQGPYSGSLGAAPPFARPPPHPSQANRQQPPPRPASHPHAHALHTLAAFGPPPSASTPLPERVAVLEHQRTELVAALSSSQRSHAELWREVQDEKRKQVALVDLLGEVYGAVQKMNSADLPYLFPSHVFQPRSSVDPSISPVEPHAPAISVSPVTAHHPSQLHHAQTKFEPYQQHQLYTPHEQESSGMFASSATSAHSHHPPPPRLVVDPYANSQAHSHPYFTLTTASSTPLPPSPAVASAPSTSAGAPSHHLVGLGLGHSPNAVGDDGFRRGAPGAAFFSFGASVRAGAEAAEEGEGWKHGDGEVTA